MNEFKVEIDGKQLKDRINEVLDSSIRLALGKNKADIEGILENYFSKGVFKNKISEFDNALDWEVEAAFREGVSKAIEELDFKEIIAKKAKELLQDDDLITQLAEAKVRSSLGLPQIEKE